MGCIPDVTSTSPRIVLCGPSVVATIRRAMVHGQNASTVRTLEDTATPTIGVGYTIGIQLSIPPADRRDALLPAYHLSDSGLRPR
jgi:hypothetical protein